MTQQRHFTPTLHKLKPITLGYKKQCCLGTGGRFSTITDGGGGSGGQAVTPAGLARAVIDFPLPCEGLMPLVTATSANSNNLDGVKDLLKLTVFQAKEAIDETEKVSRVDRLFNRFFY